MTQLTQNYFVYVRKSTDDGKRQQLTIEAQLHEIASFARSRGLKIVKTFEEHRSAKLTGRPVFQEMIHALKKGQANGIIAWQGSAFCCSGDNRGPSVPRRKLLHGIPRI
jgi:DNA invertase Pin-like site-specific DNA recombinase